MTKEEIEFFIMAIKHIPRLPKLRKEGGRKKIRGYVRKIKSVRKDRNRFFDEVIHKAIPNLLDEAMEKFIHMKIQS